MAINISFKDDHYWKLFCLMMAISRIENDKTDPMKTKTQLKMKLSTVEVSIFGHFLKTPCVKFILELK